MTSVSKQRASEDVPNVIAVSSLLCINFKIEFQQVLDLKKDYEVQARNTEQFFKELDGEQVKFNTIATYFGMDLFSEID